ncbi:MAG: hypothetical protein J6S22_00390 [Clostridia bacterium]|nr:hypothetical protein [Clostridia bacterium]
MARFHFYFGKSSEKPFFSSPLSPCNVGRHAGHYPRPQTQRAHVRPVPSYALSAYGASLFCSANGWATLPPLGFLFSLTVL